MTNKPSADPARFRQSLLRLLASTPKDEDRLLADFERKKAPDEPLYSSLLFILAHLSFPEAEAERHFKHILGHRDSLRRKLGRDPGLRVAILDYFQNVDRALENPLVIELKLYERTARSAVTDGLTGLFDHAYFKDALRREIHRAHRHGLKFCLALFDLDDFKRLNDTRGHLAGDRVLVKAASLLKESAREIDVAARYGGEEFALILPETPRRGGLVVAERVRQLVEARFGRGRGPRVTLSAGVAAWPDDALTADDMVRKADQGLYRAKALGKNQVARARTESARRRRRAAPAARGGRSTVSARSRRRRRA